MSVQATTWAWEHSESEGTTLLVLLAIADAANREGRKSCQSAETVGHMCRISSRSVRRHIQKLLDLGEVEIEGRSGVYGTNSYRLPALGHNYVLGQSDHFKKSVGQTGDNDRTSGTVDRTSGVASSDTAMSTYPNTPSTPSTPSIPDAPASRRKPRRALPTDWSPNTRHQQTAQTRNLDLTREAQAFRNHAESVDRRLADWDRGFDNWLLKAHPRKEESTIWNS